MTKRRTLRRHKLRNSSRSLHHETLEKRELLAAEFGGVDSGPRLISVAANSGEQFDLDDNNVLSVAPTELTFRFDGAQPLDPATLSAIQFRGSGGDGSFDDGNETTIIPGFLGFANDSDSRIVVARFAETLPDDQYVIEVAGFDDTDPAAPVVALRNTIGGLFCPPNPADPDRPMQTIFMDIEVGPRVVAIVPQPVVGVGAARTQLRNTVHVYFNNDPLSNPNAGVIDSTSSSLSVVDPQFYKLLYTQDTVENTDDGGPFLPTRVEYDPLLNRAVLTFALDLSELAPAAANNGSGTYRLRVGSGEAIPAPPTPFNAASDAGDTFAAAAPLGVPFGTGTQSVVVTGGVIKAAKDVIPQWPGAGDAAGLRDQRRDAAIVGRIDTNTGIDVYEYNFADLYGLDPQENKLDNAITPAQEQRAREILGLYAERLGVEFIETENRGLQIVTGDLRAIAVSADTGIDTPYSIYRVSDADPTQGVLVLDAGENWYDGYGLSPDARPSWFVEGLRGIGALLGIGNTFELPRGDGSGGSSPAEPNSLRFTGPDPNVPVEPDFLTQGNLIAGQALHRPESDDIDFYRFQATTNGLVKLETFAQRLEASSLLDTHLELYRVVAAGEYELIATNNDFYSNDSFLAVDLELPVDLSGNPIPTDYIIGVSAAGNDAYNGEVAGSGLGGLSEGAYDLRVTFESQIGSTITDTSGTELDGDADGRAGGDFNFWFRVARDKAAPAADEPRVIFVDKFAGDDFLNSGTVGKPLKTISAAFAAARQGDIVRLLPNGGIDQMINTTNDNLAFEIGFGGSGNRQLSDGGEFEVPKGVTVMIDAGAILKLRTAKLSVGSESVDEDRSLAALQILGTPQPTDASGTPLLDGLGSVFFTSYDDATLGVDTNSLNVPPQPGNWAGIEFRNDFDFSEGRAVWEREGIFLDYSSHANIRYGGGAVSPSQPIVNAIQMAESRPTLIYNTLTDNADAAMSADPDSFRETDFNTPLFQRVAAFTSDYDRVGPEISGNVLLRNSTNGLFVRVVTPAAGQLEPMTVAGRFDDRDIVHVLSQVLVLQGQPGGPLLLEQRPDVLNVVFANATGGTLTSGTFYDYRVTFVTANGRESLASLPTSMRQAPAGGAIRLNALPKAPTEFAGRRLYRLDPTTGAYEFVTQLDRGTTSYTDDGSTRGGLLPAAATAPSRLLPRFDARLSIDPGLIVKLENSRIETGFGADFFAEGVDGDQIVFTSRLDDSVGAGGTFDTNNNSTLPSGGNWGGLVFRQDSTGSLDYVQLRYAGGSTAIEGGFTEFNPIEILQADVRIAHSVLRDNADGFVAESVRGGRGFNGPATIFVRGSQPVIVDNTITDNEGAAISINPDALDFNDVLDSGRSTGPSGIVVTDQDNQGPLISGNRLNRNTINGMLVRSEVLQTESVWDDTDIVHVVQGEIDSLTHHYRGGLRLKSDPNQSLVVKFDDSATLVGGGRPLDIDDRIGGTLQVIGQPGQPVILTSINDCSVGAGFTPDGLPMNDTIGSGGCLPAGPPPDVLDVVILLDDTGSFAVAGQTLASVFPAIIAQLGIDLPNTDLAFSIARFEDYSTDDVGGFADPNDRPFILNQPLITTTTPNFAAAIDSALMRTSPGFGGDGPESGIEALFQIVTGAGFDGNDDGDTVDSGTAGLVTTQTNPGAGGDVPAFSTFMADPTGPVLDPVGTLGGIGFRDNSEKIVILATDIGFQYQDDGLTEYVGVDGVRVPATEFSNVAILTTPGGRGAQIQDTIDRLIAQNIKVIGLGDNSFGLARGPLEALATLTGATTATGRPLYFEVEPDNAELITIGVISAITGGTPNPAEPGDWQGLQLQSYVNDRNVAYVVESERAIPAAISENAIADTAQVIGDLAAHEYAGDESERLGFNIRGTLASPEDQDVYRFTADGGTVVYIDIDDTSFGLDTVVEVIDVNDQVLARSDNSFAETTNPSLLVNNLGPGAVLPLFQLGTGSVESPNSLDAGMRVVLDGTGKDNTYYVRVRNANGQSSGQYRLSIRLRETDEIAGSMIQLADIRYATDAITISGAPLHSPLAGDATENLNYLADGTPVDVDTAPLTFTEANAAHIGNLLTSDRGSLRVSGTIGNIDPSLAFQASDEIDVYQVDLFAQQIEPDVFDSENRYVTTTFDIDYADQLGRVNTSLAVFDAAGRLILHSRDSNIADDVGRPLLGDDPTNLTGGSVGVLDAHIGPVELPEGTYYVAVSSAIAVPTALDQFFTVNPTETQVRLMPINSVRRIADDSLEGFEQYTADAPIIEPLFDASSIVPYTLDDLRLFVSYDGAISGNNNSVLASFNPFTGVMDRLIGQSGQPTGDIAARRDGELYSYSLGPPNGPEDNGNVGNFLNISPANGAATNDGDDTITFQRNNQAGDDLEGDDNAQLDIFAMAFPRSGGSSINNTVVGNNERFFLVGNRDNTGRGGEIPDIYRRNLLYGAVSSNGEITSGQTLTTDAMFHRNFDGTIPYVPFYESTSDNIELGIVDTGEILLTGADGGTITGLDIIAGSEMIAVTDRGGVHVFNYRDPQLDGPGDSFTSANNIIPTTFYGVVTPDPLHVGAQVDFRTGGVIFQSLTLGPKTIEGGALSQTLFAVTEDAWLYALEIVNDVLVPANVFYNGRSAIPLTFESGASTASRSPNGIAFGNLEINPWHFTDDRGTEQDHGSEIPYDRSRLDVLGGTSLYFGFEITSDAADNTVSRDDDDPLGEISPGGPQGTIISQPFNLEEYSPDDKPTLYFTYFLEVEDDDDYRIGPRQQNDSFRAYAAGDDGQWLLLATNDDFRDLGNADEYDVYDSTKIPVQELFDDSNAWRQARVDLSPLAGNENVRIRFDFSTAGAMRQHFGSIELVAVDGDQIQNRETLQFRNEANRLVVFDNVVGRNVVIPAASRITAGDRFRVVGPSGTATITFVTAAPVNPGDVQFNGSETADQLADAVVAALPKTLRPFNEGNGLINMLAASALIFDVDSPFAQSNPTRVVQNADQLIVPDGFLISNGNEFTVVGAGTTTRVVFVTALTGAADELLYSSTETAVQIGAKVMARLPAILDPVLEIDGSISFINSPVTITFIAPNAANQFGFQPITQNRLDVVLPNGSGLVDGSQLTIRSADGDFTFTFVLNSVDEGGNTIHFQPGVSANVMAQRLLAKLPASLDGILNAAGNGILVLAEDAFGAPGVSDRPLIGVESIDFPDGSVPLFNDTLVVIKPSVLNLPVDFVLVPGPVTPPPTAPIPGIPGDPTANPVIPDIPSIPGTVFYQSTDTPDIIAANYALSLSGLVATKVTGGNVLVFDEIDMRTLDPQSSIVHGSTLGHFISLPATGAGFINGPGELVDILSPFGNFTVQFVEQAFALQPNQVFYADANPASQIEARLQEVLPSYLRAVVTTTGTSGRVVQILGATDIIPRDPASLITTGSNAYSRTVLELDIKSGAELRNGESIAITVGFQTQTITFAQAGSAFPPTGNPVIFYDPTTTAADMYDRILDALPQNFEAYIDFDGNGINVGAPGATAVILGGVAALTSGTTTLDQFALPIGLPNGQDLVNGETLTIIAKDDLNGSSPITMRFRLSGTGTPGPNEVVYLATDTPSDIARKLVAALPLELQAYTFTASEVYLLNANSVVTQPGSEIVSFALAPGSIPIQVNSSMSSQEVAVLLQSALAEGFGRLATTDGTNNASPEDFPVIGDSRIRLYNARAINVGSYGLSAYSNRTTLPTDPFAIFDSSPLPAEFFGESRPSGFAGNQIDGQGGANNNIEGVYIDDIIIGFAERGEMVLNAPANLRDFVLNPEVIPDSRPEAVQPERQNETLTGPYSLEIRTSDEFGVPEDYDPIRLNLEALFGSGRTFDTNDRLTDGAVSLIAQPGQSLIDGDTFVLSDGTRQLTFEFNSILDTRIDRVVSGNVEVSFDPSDDKAEKVAAAIRDAINSQQSRDVLEITAATGDSLEVGATTSARVELFATAVADDLSTAVDRPAAAEAPTIIVNPGGGRFIKMDLVAEETFQGRETSKLIPVIDHVNQTVTYVSNGDQQARAAVTGFADGTVDVLVATGKIGDQVNTGEGVDDAPVVLFSNPSEDVDYVRIYLRDGQTVDIDVDTEGFTRGAEVLNVPVIAVLDSTSAVIAQTSLTTPSRAPGEDFDGAFLKFQAPVSGNPSGGAYYDVAISASPMFGGFFFGDYGEYQLTIRPDAATSAAIPDRDVVMVDYQFGKSDVNRLQDQGQIIISSNFISDSSGFGVLATTGGRGEAFASNGNQVVPDDNPRPGSANLLRNINTDALIPGAVISNNVVVNSGAGGISFSGGTANNGQAPAPVPIGRIINNTVVGDGTGSGIIVSSNASPTLLNNLVSGFATGLDIDASSVAAGTIVGANAFQNNVTNSTTTLATSSVVIPGEVFKDPARRIFIPIDGSIVIDSSFSSLPDRGEFFNTVKDPVGISASPIIAPLYDAYGQPRVDDPLVNPPGAGGEVVTIDRGAIDRADRTPLVAVLTGPQDAIGTVVLGGDSDTDESFVRLVSGTVEFFEIQLLDPAGTGPDTDTITPESVLLTENGLRLTAGVDFVFGYSANSRTIRLTPLAGLWLPDAVYEITLNNQPRIAYEAPAGNQISDGDQLIIRDRVGVQSVFEFESGFTLVVPQTTLLTITGTNAVFQDRETFAITAPNGNSLTFEINISGGTAGGNVAVELKQASTIGEVRDAILATLAGNVPGSPAVTIMEFLDIDPIAVGRNQIQLGTMAGHTQPVSISGLSVSGQPGGIADGQTFSYTTSTESDTFEFDSDMLYDLDNQRIAFTRQSTPGDIARAIVAAVQLRALGLGGAVAVNDGTVALGGVAGDVLVVNQSALLQKGTPGVTGPLTLTIPAGVNAATLDGKTFSIDVDGVTITFLYTTDPTLTSPDRLILLDPADQVADITIKTAAVVAMAFPDALSPTVSGGVITLGEQAAIPDDGTPGSLTLVTAGSAGLMVGGVSGGTIPVKYLPTSPRTSIAATLQGAIASSRLAVTTFSPGGGTILISGAQSLRSAIGGNPAKSAGILTPAVADLAGNPVRETRVNNETRFTIIMPDVKFDFGDAPDTYGTLSASNGARHTVNGSGLPRLGVFVDTEADGQLTNKDDMLRDVSISQTPVTSDIFVIESFVNTDRVTLASMPVGGEKLSVIVDSVPRTFELVENRSNPTGSGFAVTFSSLDTLDEITTKLVNAIRAAIPQTDDGLLIAKDPSTVTGLPSFTITSYDDEDGLSIANLAGFDIFTLPGTDPNNVASSDVLGFLNPLDPSGTQIAVTIAGTGLLHGWVDFDRNGEFEDDEQVLRNVPVSGDPLSGTPSFFTIITPSDAIDGRTWMRLRLSQDGNLRPSGVSNGGEVEDYPVDIFSSSPPTLNDDQYEVEEGGTLDTKNDTAPPLLTPWPPVQANDVVSVPPFLMEEYSVVDSTTHGTLNFDSLTGHFVYQPDLDFNGPDKFTYRLASNAVATVTIMVKPVNNAPVLDIPTTTVDILERDDLGGTLISGFATSIAPGPPEATDELDTQTVTISFTEIDVPAGLMGQTPTLSLGGDLTVFPAADAFGQATYLVEATDDGSPVKKVSQTITINVRPVNDPPRFDPAVAGTFDGVCAAGGQFEVGSGGELLCRFGSNIETSDEAYSVSSVDFDGDGVIDDATITYNLREDNTQPLGVIADYFIPLTAAPSVGYSRLGLLDVFTVGPANEAAALPGGSQTLAFLQAGNDPVSPGSARTTDAGGSLTEVYDGSNVLIGLNYRPRLDFNESFGGVDSFTYSVRDKSSTGGETYDLTAGALVSDPLMSVNRVELVLNPVNDRPEFTVATLDISVSEDSAEVQFVNYASNINAGPPDTAFDEVAPITGQRVMFTVTSLDFPIEDSDSFFTVYPSIDEQDGLLNFQAAPDVFGDFRFELVLNDMNADGSTADDPLRGDLSSSNPVTLTINVQPINDPPIINPAAAPLAFTLFEDHTFEILVNGDGTSAGLLDPFFPGPSSGATDEAADIAPRLGGNQTVSLAQPIPTTSAEGGTLVAFPSGGPPQRFVYTPRPNFVGTDSFIYIVVDNGVTVDIDGVPFSDPRIASNTVTFEVKPVNDAPLFSGAPNVASAEDDGLKTFPGWATNVQAGPTTAIDEINGIGATPAQSLEFVFTQTTANPELFLTPPMAIIDRVTGTATLSYQTNPDANGFAVFEVVLQDSGPSDGSIGDMFVSSPPRTFSIDVAAVNDRPTFVLASNLITRPEDSGPYSVLQAINISPGPADEQSQTVSFHIQPLAAEFRSLFSEPPTINADGVLRFTPAANQNTGNSAAIIRVIARDSGGAEAAEVEFQIKITEVNDAPRAVADKFDTDEDTVLVIPADDLISNDTDPDLLSNPDEVLSVVMPSQSLSVSGAPVTYGFNPVTNRFEVTYDPTDAIAVQSLGPGDTLVDSFAYSLVDAAGLKSNLTTVALTVVGINDKPVAVLDTPQLKTDGPTVIRVLDNDYDVDGFVAANTVRISLQPAFGSVAVQPDGTLIYTPFSSFSEEDVFAYTVDDNLGLRSDEALVTIAANASPIAGDDAKGTFLDEAISIDVAANDFDPDRKPSDPNRNLDLASIIIVDQPNRGVAFAQADGTVRYVPAPGFIGRDSFQYRIADLEGRFSNVATVDTQVVASRLQNPDDSGDVNDDGSVTALDALLIINHLRRADGASSIPVLETDRGPNYYDVSGNKLISAADALRVINQISRESQESGLSEQVRQPLSDDAAKDDASAPADVVAPIDLIGPAKIVNVSSPVSMDVVDLIARDRDADDEDESLVAAIDAAMADLL